MSTSIIAAACGLLALLGLGALVGVVVYVIKKKPHEAIAAGLSEAAQQISDKWEETREAWRSAATSRGLDFQPETGFGVGRISGALDGRRVTALVEHHHQRDHGSHVTVVTTELPVPLGLGLRASSSAISGSAIFGALTGKRVHTGDAAFDEAWKVYGNEEAAVAAVLDAEVRQAMMRWLPPEGTLEVGDKAIVWRRNGYVSSGELLLAAMDAGREIAAALQDRHHGAGTSE